MSLPTLKIETLWLPLVEHWIAHHFEPEAMLYLAIDRTRWAGINLLMVSVVWQHRAIPVWCEQLDKLGNSNFEEQTAILSKVLALLASYRVAVLGDREFCSVKLGRWLGENHAYFSLRLKRNTEIGLDEDLSRQLQDLGLAPGQNLFLNDVRVTQNKGFGTFNVAAKWKRRYRGFATDEAWFILTNFDTLDTAIQSYQKRFSIEEMFRDFKLGGYCLEGCQATGERLISIIILISIAYTSATQQGQTFKRQGMQRYIARPESKTSSRKRHSAFRVGLSAYRWAVNGDDILTGLVEALMQLNPNKKPEYKRGMRAMELVLKGF